MTDLAIMGGEPFRKRPFQSSVVIDEAEWETITEVLRNREFSRFMGSPTEDIEKMLTLSSAEAVGYSPQYFTFLGGKMVRRFEAAFAGAFDIAYAVSVNSATTGLATALAAAGVGPGDEVITTCLSFNATAMSILAFNSMPVFVDIDPANYCLRPELVEKAIGPRTRAIMVVHLLGYPADMDAIMDIAHRHSLVVIEDTSQAIGTRYKGRLAGTIGDMGVFSFQETKNMQTGEGGMIITGNPRLARNARLIRNHGESVPDETWDDEDLCNLVGMNFRMTELTAALGLAQLGKLHENNRVRTLNAQFLSRELAGLPGLSVPCFDDGVVPHIFPLVYDESVTGVERNKVVAALRSEGIPVGTGYVRTMYENPVFLRKVAYGKRHCPWACTPEGMAREYRKGDCPVAENLIYKQAIWIYHIFRPNGLEDMEDVDGAFRKVFGNLEHLKSSTVTGKVGYKW